MEKTAPPKARCHAHPAAPAVGTCEACQRPVCLECAVPVRGEIIGRECLPDVLPDPPPPEETEPRPGRNALDRVLLAGFVITALASVLQWSRFGVGSGLFGGWGFSPPRWASAVGPLVLLGLAVLLTVARPAAKHPPSVRLGLPTALAAIILVLAALAIAHPPPFTRTTLSAWLAATGGAIATGAGTSLLLGERRAASRPPREALSSASSPLP